MLNEKNLSPEQEAARQTWQYRAVAATRGNQSLLGAILLAVIGKAADNPPKFHGSATITSDGFVLCNFTNRRGEFHHSAFVCSVDDLQRNFSGLADHLKLNDADRVAMFQEVKKWIFKDYRAETTLHFTQGE